MKDKLSLEEIKSIVQFLEEHNVYEFSLERGPEKLHLKRGSGEQITQVLSAPAQAPVSAQAQVASEEKLVVPAPEAKNYHEVTSPMVGTFYSRPAPDKEPFVKVGQKVSKGDVICIIEAMKVMNEIESDASGTVVEVCLDDAHVAEYNEVLIKIDQNA